MTLPTPKKTFPCSRCGAAREHTLQTTAQGCEWTCSSCQLVAKAYTREEMRDLLFRWTRGFEPKAMPDPSTLPSTVNVKVFIEGAEAPVELAPQFVEQHVQITGKLPKIGEPMYTTLPGLPPVLSTVPYGKVVRLEHTKEDT